MNKSLDSTRFIWIIGHDFPLGGTINTQLEAYNMGLHKKIETAHNEIARLTDIIKESQTLIRTTDLTPENHSLAISMIAESTMSRHVARNELSQLMANTARPLVTIVLA